MIPEFGFFELIVVAVAALVVVGPKDLPKLLRGLGGVLAKVRGLAAEFRAAFDQMARETELDELRDEVRRMKDDNPIAAAKRDVESAIDPIRRDMRAEAADMSRRREQGGKTADSDAPDTPAGAGEPATDKRSAS